MFKPQLKHKAKHSGYKGKPTKKSVVSLINFYDTANQITVKPNKK